MQIDDIVNKEFSRSFMGYDMREVDSFLDDIIDKLERYESERREMLTAMEYLLDKLERGGALPSGKQELPAGEDLPRKRSRGPRTVRGAAKGQPPKAEDVPPLSAEAEQAAEVEVAIEMELMDDAPGMDELFPEILETLAEMDIPTTPKDGDEKSAS